MSTSSHSSLNYVSDILEEIALEGLDGITVEALWMRLSVRPKFMFNIDRHSKNFVWNIVIQLKDLQFYELPEERPSLKHYDYSISEENICNEIRQELDEVYPYSSVKITPGVFGSCLHYLTRVNVTNEVTHLTEDEVKTRWGNKLVIVASQECRYSALFGGECSPDLDFSSSSVLYEVLERIGRCRQLGILTCGKGSLQSVVGDVRSIFHYLKILINHKLVKKQSLLGSLSSTSHASVAYLSRFFEETTNENISILRVAVEELKMRPPLYMMPCDELYGLFDGAKKKRIKKYKTSVVFRRYISVTPNLPYRTVYPNASQAEWEKKSKAGEKTVRCFKLINPDMDLNDLTIRDCDSDEEDGVSGFLPKGIFYKSMPIVFQAYHHIKNAGARGLSHGELGQIMGLNKCFIRTLIKRLCGDKLCKFYVETEGKRRSKRYIVGEHAETKAAASEIAQILLETPKSDLKKKQPVEETSSEEPKKLENLNLPKLQDDNISYRGLKRIGLIIKTIKTHRFRLFHQINKFVHEEEKKEGLTITVDRQTIHKLLKKLEQEGLIKKIVFTGKDGTGNPTTIFTDPTFELDDKIKEKIYASNVLSLSTANDGKEEWTGSLESEFSVAIMENIAGMQKMLSDVVQASEKPVEKESHLAHLYSPKFIRLNIIHEFMFHLVYDYTGIKDRNQEELITELSKTTAIDDDLKSKMPRLYATEPSAFMFVPPLTSSGKICGWFLISDLLTRMPLSIMVKVIKVTESCPELSVYLDHPVRKHFLVKDLPLSVRRIFFGRKNQTVNFYYDIRRLCFIGLIQFGPKFGKENYLTLLYLNRKASLLDTSPSTPAYVRLPSNVEFSSKLYEFRTKNDVEKYWMDMYNICMGTKLGEKEFMVGDENLGERELTKESLKKYLEPKSVEQALECDNGEIPGDHLGAAGVDSIMFSFLRHNWNGPLSKKLPKTLYPKNVKKIAQVSADKVREEKKFGSIKTRRKVITVNVNKVRDFSAPKGKQKKKVKKAEPKKRLRKPSYDETDLEALKLLNSLRVTWSTVEDNLLLLCRVAIMFLCPNTKTFAKIPRSEVRLALQHYIPESRNKTQRAIGRRILYMMKNPTTARSVELCLEELKRMPESKSFCCREIVESIKPSASDLDQKQQELYKKFHEVLAFLKDRFMDNPSYHPGKENDLIPDSLEEFFDKFVMEEVPAKETLDIKTIRENVIRGILMSSFCCRSDKTSSAVQLFDIYRQYNEDELQNAFQSLHSDKVVTVKRKAKYNLLKTGNILPLSFSPYKLSCAFQNMLNTKYGHNVYPESYSQIMRLLQSSEDSELPVNLNEFNIVLFLLASQEIVSFIAVLPEQIISIDKGDLSDKTFSKLVVKYQKMLEYSKLNSKVICTSGKAISKTDDTDSLEASCSKKRRMSTLETKEEIEEDGDLMGIEKRTKSSRVILYMMREEAQKDAKQELGGRSMIEFCVVNSSEVFVKCNKLKLELVAEKMSPKIADNIIKKTTSQFLYPVNLVDEDVAIQDAKNRAAESIVKFITSKQELGATAEDLRQNFPTYKLETISLSLQSLLDSKVILKSGINETRYVSQKYATPWLLGSFKVKRLEREKLKPYDATAVSLFSRHQGPEDENPRKKLKGCMELKGEDYNPPIWSTDENNRVKIIIRPWIRIDGSLNRKVLDRFLGTILGFVLSHPGCKLKDIMNQFVPWITPVWTKDLVEILRVVGCVTMKTLKIVEKATLFSSSHIVISDKYTGLEDDDCVVVEAEMDAISTLGLFIGKKTYSKDFLSD